MGKTFRQQLEEICTYHSEFGEGTSGYSLSNEQFAEIEQAVKDLIERAKPPLWEYNGTEDAENNAHNDAIDDYHDNLIKEIKGSG